VLVSFLTSTYTTVTFAEDFFKIFLVIYSAMFGVHFARQSHILDDKRAAPSMSAAITRDMQACRAIMPLCGGQVFTVGPRSSAAASVDYQACRNLNIFLIVHAAYVSAGIWQVTRANQHTKLSKRRLALFAAHLRSCVLIGSDMLVLHLPRAYPDEICETMEVIAPIAAKHGVRLALEMTASKSHADRTYETPEKMDNLSKLLHDRFKNKWCWAIDTAHLWSTGSDIRGAAMAAFFDRLAYKKMIGLIHLNGSSVKLGAGSDKHEIAGGPRDAIFSAVNLAAVVRFAQRFNIPVVCEVNRGTQADFFALLRKIKNTKK
jgi:endonuclease IV